MHTHRGHSHSHGDEHLDPAQLGRLFAFGIGLNVVYVLIEAVAGWRGGSLALLADAGHNALDVLGLILAWIGTALAALPATNRRTYGWRSSSILAALGNALLLLIGVGSIAWEAVQRIGEPAEVLPLTMIWVAAVGIAINAATAAMFFSGRRGDINVQGAFLHMAADAAISLGVVLSGIAIALTGYDWIDPVVSLVIAAVILWSTWDLLITSFNLMTGAVPTSIDLAAVRKYLSEQPGVLEIRDLHVWAMSTSEIAMTAHLLAASSHNSHDELLKRCRRELHDRFAIEHTTIEIASDPGVFEFSHINV